MLEDVIEKEKFSNFINLSFKGRSNLLFIYIWDFWEVSLKNKFKVFNSCALLKTNSIFKSVKVSTLYFEILICYLFWFLFFWKNYPEFIIKEKVCNLFVSEDANPREIVFIISEIIFFISKIFINEIIICIDFIFLHLFQSQTLWIWYQNIPSQLDNSQTI